MDVSDDRPATDRPPAAEPTGGAATPTAGELAAPPYGVRPSVGDLAAYRPGKSAAALEAEHQVVDAIKLASNENPFPPIPAVQEALAEAASHANLYADHRAGELRQRLAESLAVDVEQVAVGCGSVGLLQQLCLTYVDPGDEVVFPWISFEAYPILVKAMSGVAVTAPLVDHRADLDRVAEAVTDKTKMVLLANPNNPTGTAVSTAEIGQLVARLPERVIVVVDEAYREFVDPSLGDPISELVPQHPNVVVTRTFSKAYGLAGARVGYAVCHPSIVAEIDKILLPFAVNGPGQAAALAALAYRHQIQPSIERLVAERQRVVASLRHQGWTVPDPQGNFVYLPTGQRTLDVHLSLERLGLGTRPFPGEGLRITVGTPEANDRLLKALSDQEPVG
jgi:histidinol-phosphate aminotransferase